MSSAAAAPLDPVSIGYKIKVKSARFDATLGRIETSLNTTESGYKIDTVTKFQGLASIIGGSNLRESCEFSVEDGRAVPRKYEGGRIKSKSSDYQVNFDWQNQKLSFNDEDALDMPQGYVVDICSLWFAMAIMRGEGLKDELLYSIDGKNKRIRGFRFRSLEDDTIETKIGTKEVLKLVLERDFRPDRTTTFWLSKEDQYLPLRAQEKRKSRTTTFSVEKLEPLN